MTFELPRVRVSFCLTGADFDLDTVTKVLQIIPTSTRTKRDWPVAAMAKTCWELETEKEECKAVSWQFAKIMEKLSGREERIKALCRDLELEVMFTIVIDMESANGPELVLTKEIVQFIGSMGAEVGFDVYVD
ncbi:hypothetical protein PWEIH_14851 [Listeria weihenstephanensis FSL R9-0317]|uniref:DUF4279 domain-containing protein n=1 Tax=Listeria weihenstephanensis TaxID=1006155 RepID=A0A1S7FVI7_9LIST|nr:DUF4279 domain-containing protein [Listeria weihenstephanensis]AQY51474.1 hypothetical protein UE46_10785 [Listeria weihenstephanensis]EUJ35832.1 hypothetical protein PWEIH_14851 [Listeria weihenstephanensis FSL R9-0317]